MKHKRYSKSGRIPWNKGLTKKSSKYVRNQARLKSIWWKTHDTTETRRKIGLASKLNHKNHPRLGKDSPGWKGGRFKESRKGYIYIYLPNHPLAIKNGNKKGGHYLEHRYVMEKHLGRLLTLNEEVHHKNGIKDDNRLSNLELMVKHQHFGKVQCPYCNKKFKVK